MKTRIVSIVVIAGALAAGFIAGIAAQTSVANASASHRYTLRVGDKVAIPAVRQHCAVELEGGAPNLFCARTLHAHHQVTIFRDNILVWKIGDPDHPAWHGRP